MNDELITEQQTAEDGSRISITDILYVLRAHLLLIIIITVLFAAGGFVYSKIRKPVYTASVPVVFDVSGIKQTDKDEEDQSLNYTYLSAYIGSVAEICTSGKTIDRANVYYAYYLNSGKKINEFITDLNESYKTVKDSREELPDYPVNAENIKEYRNKYFTSDKVGTDYKYSADSKGITVNFGLWAKDLDTERAKEMASIYAFAADISLNQILEFGKSENSGHAGIINLSGSISGVSVSSDISTMKAVVIAMALGLALALMTVYILHLTDNTIKSKEQLEEMSGASVIAYIEDVAEVK